MLTRVFIAVTLETMAVQSVTEIKVGVLLIADSRVPYSVHRVAPAVDIALETVNRDLLNDSYRLVSELRIYDDICDARYATGVASDLFHKHHVSALIGPACAYSLHGVGRLAAYWNIPIVTGLGDGGEFKNKTDFPTLTRFAYCQCRLRKVFGSVFRHFAWSDLVVIYDMDDIHSDVLGNTLKVGLRKGGYYPYMIQFYESRRGEIENILLDASRKARVLLLILPGDILRLFMLAAHGLGFPQSGDYVFMDVQLFDFPGKYWGNHRWWRGDDNDDHAREAYDALLRISLYQSEGEEWETFSRRVVNMSEEQYNFTFGSEEVNFFVGAFHDAVIRYGLALNETLTLGDDVTEGRTVTRRMWDLTLQGVTGDVIIDDNGDRDTNFAIQDMNMTTGEFQLFLFAM
nr:hypothetical protein BaRGS_028430 [Batillaria attramentaria]